MARIIHVGIQFIVMMLVLAGVMAVSASFIAFICFIIMSIVAVFR